MDVPGNLLPGSTREVVVWRMGYVTLYMSEKCGVVTGWSLASDVEGRTCGTWRGRGVCEEPVRTNLATPIPTPIALSILYMNTVWRPMLRPVLNDCYTVNSLLEV